jgi:[amino-group carrier protein]-gamma-(L-lysyl/L-ornithyl)-L-glutamate aminotransferase
LKDYGLLQKKYLAPTFPNRGVVIVEGEGVYLKDIQGVLYLDAMTNYGVNVFGHHHPEVTAALSRQLARLTTLHGSFANDERAEAAQLLVGRCGGGLARVYFANSGAEANEAALKFAALATGRKKFIACRGGYHGKTLGALSATDGEKYRRPFEPLVWDFRFVGYGDLGALEQTLDGDSAALIIEPVQGESGVRLPPAGYLREAAGLCRAKGALLIVDEVQTGAGRTGRFLRSQAEGLSGDIVTLGKGLAGGIPVGAALVSAPVAERIPRGSHTSTFGGNPLACAGITATLRLLDDDLLEHVGTLGCYFLAELRRLSSPLIKEVRGEGLMIGLEVTERRDDVLKGLQRERILAIPAGDNVVRFLPPYIFKKEHVDAVVAGLEPVLAAAAAPSS